MQDIAYIGSIQTPGSMQRIVATATPITPHCFPRITGRKIKRGAIIMDNIAWNFIRPRLFNITENVFPHPTSTAPKKRRPAKR